MINYKPATIINTDQLTTGFLTSNYQTASQPLVSAMPLVAQRAAGSHGGVVALLRAHLGCGRPMANKKYQQQS